MSTGGARTVVVGFDALDFEYLDRFADSLPNFRRLRRGGTEAPLESTLPPWTGSAWPSMYTGTDPSYHGVYDFFVHDRYPDETTSVTRADVHQPALWNYLSAEGRPSVVMNVPVTHPAEAIEGTVIPGYLAPEDAPGHPEGVRDELSDAIGEEYRIYSRAETADDKDEKLAGYLDLVDLRRRAAVELLTSREWELAVVQVQKTDAVFHNFSEDDAFRRVYEAADEFLGSVLDAVDDDVNVVVCSDHGIGRKEGYAIYLNEILRQHGYVEATTDGEGSSLNTVMNQLTDAEADGEAEAGDDPDLLARATAGVQSALRRVGITPVDVYSAAQRLGVGETLKRALPAAQAATAEVVDWRASQAYCRSKAELGVRINLEGREAAGTVPRSRYEAVRDDIIELLRDVETPDGRPAFERVARREAVYEGPYAEDACDIVVVPTDMDHTVGTKLYGGRFHPIDIHDHETDGVFIADGPDVDSSASVASLSLTDVAPLAMALVGQPVPERMTGTVPADVVTRRVGTADYGDVDYGSGSGIDAGDEAVTERLEDLGYI